jgi:integrase
LREHETASAIAFRFAILTASRPGEVTGARWGEIDLTGRVWTIPAARMKAGREHRVPLSPQAIELLERMLRGDDSVFGIGPTSINQLNARLRMGVTAHGSSFRVWAAEQTSFPSELAEMALAHRVGGAVERAYQRSDLFARRRSLMDAWGNYCTGTGAEVVQLRASGGN